MTYPKESPLIPTHLMLCASASLQRLKFNKVTRHGWVTQA